MAKPLASFSLVLAICHCFHSCLLVRSCDPSGRLIGQAGNCNTENGASCCVAGMSYTQYQCSPPVTAQTQAQLTLNGFAPGEDGGGRSQCDNSYHDDTEMIVALSTGWYDNGSRCSKNININANGRTVQAKVVDQCDSVNGCDEDHAFQPPCGNDIVDASQAVWDALGISSDLGHYEIKWSDA